jgi:hypothetical protein
MASPTVDGKQLTIKKNPTGGQTIETIFEPGDEEYRFEKQAQHFNREGYRIRDENTILANEYNNLGIKTTVEHYHRDGTLERVLIHFREDKALAAGYHAIEVYLDRDGHQYMMDIFFLDIPSDEQIYTKSRTYYDIRGRKRRTTYFFNDKTAARTGYFKYEDAFDSEGNLTHQQFFHRDYSSERRDVSIIPKGQ